MQIMKDISVHNREALKLERWHMVNNSRVLYTALEEMNFHWDFDQVKEFKKMWRKGFSLIDIAEYFDRPQEEVAVLLIDQSMKSFVKARKGGLFGKNKER